MKKSIATLLLCLLLTALAARAEAQPDYRFARSFQIRSGYVEYRLSEASPEEIQRGACPEEIQRGACPEEIQRGEIAGSKSFWWDGYGERYREEISLDGRKSSLSVADGRYFYTVNLRTMQGTKVRADVAAQVQSHFDGGRCPPEARGSETILGRLCERTESDGAVVSSYKGVPLRVDDFGIVEEAVLFEENVPVDEALFAPPAGVRFEDATEALRSELLPQQGGEYDHADDAPYPAGISFEKFVSECRFVGGNAGFRPTLEHASFGMYSSYWENEAGGFLAFEMQALAINLDWQVIHGESAEMFEHAGRRMAFSTDVFYDEEEGRMAPVSILIVEMQPEDGLLLISTSPERMKAGMTAIFDELNF